MCSIVSIVGKIYREAQILIKLSENDKSIELNSIQDGHRDQVTLENTGKINEA